MIVTEGFADGDLDGASCLCRLRGWAASVSYLRRCSELCRVLALFCYPLALALSLFCPHWRSRAVIADFDGIEPAPAHVRDPQGEFGHRVGPARPDPWLRPSPLQERVLGHLRKLIHPAEQRDLLPAEDRRYLADGCPCGKVIGAGVRRA